ncbi:MAG: hypothetical protein IJE07_08065 [Clostridia bacterium]|nr:hypothetical protein [Clostridia bacterium]
MKRILVLLLVAAMALICIPALAEGAYFSGERGNNSRPALAVVNGQVYGLSGHEGAMAMFTPAVERWSPSGKRTRVGQNAFLNSEIGYISGAGDALLILREERNWLELLDPTAAFTPRAELWYPATGRSVRIPDGAFALQGRLFVYRDGQLQQLSADGREVVASWAGKPVYRWDSFILLQDGERHQVLEIASGVCWDVTALKLDLGWSTEAVVEDGVMYLLEGAALTAIDLRDGARECLLSFPEDAYSTFLLDAERVILLCSKKRGEPATSAVYDRATLACTQTFTHRTNPVDALLVGDQLYMRDPYGFTYLGAQERWSDPASASIIDLTTGSEVYWELNE